MKNRALFISALLLIYASIGLVAGCGGSSGGGDGESSNSLKVGAGTFSPSLGAIENATVNLYEADGETLLSSLELDESNAIDFDLSGYSEPVVVEVLGDADATYYDESALTELPFPDGEALYALIPEPTGDITATLLTDLAYQIAEENNLWPVNTRTVNALNQMVASALAPELDNITEPPAIFDSSTTAGSLDDDHAGRYAAKLAALSVLADGEAAPSLFILDQLRTDVLFSDCDPQLGCSTGDGDFDSIESFVSQLESNLEEVVNDYGTSALQAAVNGFDPVQNHLNQGFLTLGVGQQGATFNLAGQVLTADSSQITVAGPDEEGFLSITVSIPEGTTEIRQPNELGRHECSDDDSGTVIETHIEATGAVIDTTGVGSCVITTIQADGVIEGFASGTYAPATPIAPPLFFTDGYFYLEFD